MLLHHTDCGLAGLDEEELASAVEAETGVRPPFAFQGFDDVDDSVRQSMARLRSSPFIPRTERIRGYVYDVDTETLREVTYDPTE
jgi:carbonic anhydrase